MPENVTANLRTILYQEMARDDNNFVIVFTANENAPNEVLDSPLLGEVKLVVPPPDREARRRLVRYFLRRIAGDRWSRLLEAASKRVGADRAEELLYTMYADAFVPATVGLTSGEIYRVMRSVLLPAFNRSELPDVSKEIEAVAKRDYAARQARLKTLLKRAVSPGMIDVAEDIKRVIDEVSRAAIEMSKIMEKYKDY
jgi:SpoVK/Ycf46/Vps4 family AAA+-type ATPase